jgi:hypothetical protein
VRKRLAYNVLVLVALATLPWWTSLIFLLVGLFTFSHFWESLIYAFVFDSLYVPITAFPYALPFFITTSALYLIVEFILKKHIR